MMCVELFAGAGGAALGLEAAGIEHAALCEWDPYACATLRAAGLGPVVEGDVRELDAIEAVAGPSCDLLWSSFPCQAFSTAGKRLGASDERNGWPWTVDAIDRFRPRWFLAENVRGLLTHSTEGHPDPFQCPRCYFEGVILPQLRARFAYVGWWLLDAADYGVPQHRRRVIIWAGPAPVKAPRPTHGDPAAARQGALFGPGLLPWVTMAEALNLKGARFTERNSGMRGHTLIQPGAPAPTVRAGSVRADNGFRVIHGMQIGNTGPFVCATTGNHRDGRPVLPVFGPSPPVTTKTGKVDAWNHAGVPFINGVERRRLSVTETARLQDFPAGHPWQGPKTAQYRQIGNAVPPRLAEVVGRAVMQAERCGHE